MRILPYITSIIFFFMCTNIEAQEKEKIENDTLIKNKKILNVENDTLVRNDTLSKPKYKVYKTNYGLRLGADISKPILALTNKDYKGIEFVGDYRFARKWYAAAEIGYEKKTFSEEVMNVTSSGQFIRIGANRNAYNNWMDMTNEIYFGARYGYGRYQQTLNEYIPNAISDYFEAPVKTSNFKMPGLDIHWFELQLGIKVETFKNIYVGFHGSYKIGLSVEKPEKFQALYAPGFNRIFESKTGFGFNYTVSYLIPFFKK